MADAKLDNALSMLKVVGLGLIGAAEEDAVATIAATAALAAAFVVQLRNRYTSCAPERRGIPVEPGHGEGRGVIPALPRGEQRAGLTLVPFWA
eukprot:CAMPEP_0197614424 /NCGR_PEP_ID=MMETSP1326-20131121/59519_1 /TAXON_ID=1155430 /ORGANISM="Genus nov. species nov., Strain RCC2288" /LENGTH=92 /DNA_ID=CAMNT_0043183297 /DNA_START=274 /DNA_END=552 /DNA_ORIENTATION=-